MINVARQVRQRGVPGCFRIPPGWAEERQVHGRRPSRRMSLKHPCSRERTSTVESTAAATCSIVRGMPANVTPPSPLSAECERTSLLFSSSGRRRPPEIGYPRLVRGPLRYSSERLRIVAKHGHHDGQSNGTGAIHLVISGSGLPRTASTVRFSEAVSQQPHRLE